MQFSHQSIIAFLSLFIIYFHIIAVTYTLTPRQAHASGRAHMHTHTHAYINIYTNIHTCTNNNKLPSQFYFPRSNFQECLNPNVNLRRKIDLMNVPFFKRKGFRIAQYKLRVFLCFHNDYASSLFIVSKLLLGSPC